MTVLDQVRTKIACSPLWQFALAAGFVGLDVITRLLPQSLNCTAVAATALLAGAIFQSAFLAVLVPLAGMGLSEPFLPAEDWRILAVVYAALVVPVCIGHWARRYHSAIVLLPLACAGSLLFFIMTNFAVWAVANLYPHDAGGLVACYVAALPFLRNTVLGDIGWLTVLLGGFWVARRVAAIGPALAAQ